MKHTNYSTSNYTYSDVYCQGSIINVPFSWEYKPGLSKVNHHDYLSNNGTRGSSKLVLQPPPCSSFGTRSDTSIRTSSFRIEGTQKQEDPFVEAYKRCTKSPSMLQRCTSTSNSRGKKCNGSSWTSIRKYMHMLSCKYAGDVASGKVVYTCKV